MRKTYRAMHTTTAAVAWYIISHSSDTPTSHCRDQRLRADGARSADSCGARRRGGEHREGRSLWAALSRFVSMNV